MKTIAFIGDSKTDTVLAATVYAYWSNTPCWHSSMNESVDKITEVVTGIRPSMVSFGSFENPLRRYSDEDLNTWVSHHQMTVGEIREHIRMYDYGISKRLHTKGVFSRSIPCGWTRIVTEAATEVHMEELLMRDAEVWMLQNTIYGQPDTDLTTMMYDLGLNPSKTVQYTGTVQSIEKSLLFLMKTNNLLNEKRDKPDGYDV